MGLEARKKTMHGRNISVGGWKSRRVHRSGEGKRLGEAPMKLLPPRPTDPESVLWVGTELDAGVWGSLSH